MPVKELYQNTYMISLRHGLHGQITDNIESNRDNPYNSVPKIIR